MQLMVQMGMLLSPIKPLLIVKYDKFVAKS